MSEWDLYMRATNGKGEEATYSEVLDICKDALRDLDRATAPRYIKEPDESLEVLLDLIQETMDANAAKASQYQMTLRVLAELRRTWEDREKVRKERDAFRQALDDLYETYVPESYATLDETAAFNEAFARVSKLLGH